MVDQILPVNLHTVCGAINPQESAILTDEQWAAVDALPPWVQTTLNKLYGALGPILLAWLKGVLDDLGHK